MRLGTKIKFFFKSIFGGMKVADDEIISGAQSASAGNGLTDEYKVESEGLYANLLKGEVTQEVKDLRYETYESVRRSEEWSVKGFSGKAVRKNKILDNTPGGIDVSDGLKVVLVQDNRLSMEGVDGSLKNLEKYLSSRVEADAEHTLIVKHEYQVRHRIEAFTRKVVVKKTSDNGYVLDFYLSKHPTENDPRAVYITKEMESLFKSGSRTSDLTDVKALSLVTDRAYGDDDLKLYTFSVEKYLGIHEYDGAYILSFSSIMPNPPIDLTEEYKDPVSVDKFEKKQPRNKKSVSLTDAIDAIKEKEEEPDLQEMSKKAKKIVKRAKKKDENLSFGK